MRFFFTFILFFSFAQVSLTQSSQSVSRKWMDTMLQAIREDFARPPVQARNLFHVSAAMYDAWAVYDGVATTYLLGKSVGTYDSPFTGITSFPSNVDIERQKAISYAAYRVLLKRYANSPNASITLNRFHNLMFTLGYDTAIRTINYSSGAGADMGNYIASEVLAMGLTDGSRESENYQNLDYTPRNTPINTEVSGNPNMTNPNLWQPLFNVLALDQNGNPINATQKFEGAEWGRVTPFALQNPINYTRFGKTYPVYLDPGAPPMLDTLNINDSSSYYFKKGHAMVAVWSSHLTPDDGVEWDISPNAKGNVQSLPTSRYERLNFYNYYNGGDPGTGYTTNPFTNAPYAPQLVKRGDYTRVASQYWADGPTSETPPGHWFTFLHKVNDHPSFIKKFEGVGNALTALEWDVKAYFMLGSAMHDAAIAAWSIKGWYDAARPFSAIRKMAAYGQSTEPTLPKYHAGGLPILPGYIETIEQGDPLAGFMDMNVGQLKVRSWVGFGNIGNSTTDYAGVDWIEAANWRPYQRATFVTPPFGGYLSGHSTYSRAGAEVLTNITGSEFFPGGLAEFVVPANSNFLGFEKGPSTTVKLQWATYRDASNESSLSRIWGGIHPHFDDIPGRVIGEQVGTASFFKAKAYFTGTILPVSLSQYNAFEKNCVINIVWKSTQENNLRQYKVVKSNDGINFNTLVGTVAAASNSTSPMQYYLSDYNASEQNYYKLIAIDNNGKEEHERILSVNAKKCFAKNDFVVQQIYPNPVMQYASINVFNNKTEKTYKLLVYTSNGVTIKSQQGVLVSGNNIISVNLQNLKRGVYFVRIISDNKTVSTQKMIKK